MFEIVQRVTVLRFYSRLECPPAPPSEIDDNIQKPTFKIRNFSDFPSKDTLSLILLQPHLIAERHEKGITIFQLGKNFTFKKYADFITKVEAIFSINLVLIISQFFT